MAGLILAFLLPKQYQSVTQLMPPDTQPSSSVLVGALAGAAGNGLSALAGDVLGLKNSGALFVGILHSATVQGRLVQRFDLKKVYGDTLEEDARKDLASHTAISEDRKSGIISIVVTDHAPWRAADLAQAYVEELNRLAAELSTSGAHRERVFLEDRLRAVKQDLDQASHDFSEFSSKNTTIDIKEQGRAMVEAAANLQGELIASKSQLESLEQIYTANNVRVRSVQARITELQKQLDKLGGDTSVQTGDAASNIYPSIRQLPLLGVTYADLYRKTKIQEALYEALTQQYELAKVQEAKETPSVKVLDVAGVPEKKSFPPRMLIVSVCTFLAAGLGATWLLGRARWRQLDSGDPGKLFATEVLHSFNARMPWAEPNGSRLQAATHQIWLRLRRRQHPTEA